MKQRFQNAEIELVNKLYAENELYKAICSIGPQLETELTKFGLCPEECFADTMELLCAIVSKGQDVLEHLPNLWLRKYNEYRRFDRSINPEEHRKAVGIVFGFAVLATDSSNKRFYRHQLVPELTSIVGNNKFDGWDDTLNRIFSVPLSDGWFDRFSEDTSGQGGMDKLSQQIDKIQKLLPNANNNLLIIENQYNSNCQQFLGEMKDPRFTTTPAEDEAI